MLGFPDGADRHRYARPGILMTLTLVLVVFALTAVLVVAAKVEQTVKPIVASEATEADTLAARHAATPARRQAASGSSTPSRRWPTRRRTSTSSAGRPGARTGHPRRGELRRPLAITSS